MGIEIASSFTRKSTEPIDDLSVVADLTARDAIEAGVRYEGMVVYVTAEGANYQLIGGIENSNWEDFGGGGGGSGGGVVELKPNDLDPAPSLIQTNPINYWRFSDSSEMLWGLDVVPASYKSGDKINLELGKVFVNSTDTDKKVFLQVVAFVFSPDDDLTSLEGYSGWNSAIGVTGYSGWMTTVGGTDVSSSDNGMLSSKIEIGSNGEFYAGAFFGGGEQDGYIAKPEDILVFGVRRYDLSGDSFLGPINLVDKTFRLNYKGN